jgi:cation diffusion facilitator family transporter
LARLSAAIGLILAALKTGVGWAAGSIAVIADGFESAGDCVASLILWTGLRIAAKPPDEDHPYGHGRFEILAGQAIGSFLAASGLLLVWGSFSRISGPSEPPRAFAIWTVVVSILVKLALAQWKRRTAKAIHSAALEADAKNDWLDVISGLIAIAALGLNTWDPARFPHADAAGGVLVGILVTALGAQVLREASWQLLDTMPPGAMLEDIRAQAARLEGVRGIEKCRARKTGLQYHVDLHVEVDPAMTVEAAHRIGGRVRQSIRENVPWVADVLIHIEPAPTGKALVEDREIGRDA